MTKEETTEIEAKAEITEAKASGNVDGVENSVSDDVAAANAEANNSQAESVNDRLLKESKTWKAKATEAQKELERLKEAERKKQGKWQEIAQETQTKLEDLQKKIIKQKVATSLAQAAPKYGWAGKNLDTLLRLGDHSLLQYDEAGESVEGVESYMEALKKAEPTLFRNIDARINDKAPNASAPNSKKQPTTFDEQYRELTSKLAQSLGQ
jgi:hypothetical protein